MSPAGGRIWHSPRVPVTVIDNPILDSAFAEPPHMVLDENGMPTRLATDSRRRSEFVVPVPPPGRRRARRKRWRLKSVRATETQRLHQRNSSRVAAWRALADAGLRSTVTPVTARLLRHWRGPGRGRDIREGEAREAEITGRPVSEETVRGDIRQGFVLERVPHVTLKSIANHAEIDVIHDKWQPPLDAALAELGTTHEEWQVPRHTARRRTIPRSAGPRGFLERSMPAAGGDGRLDRP